MRYQNPTFGFLYRMKHELLMYLLPELSYALAKFLAFSQALATAIQCYANRSDARIVYSTTWWESLIFLPDFDEILYKLSLSNAFLENICLFQNSKIHNMGIHNIGCPKRVSMV